MAGFLYPQGEGSAVSSQGSPDNIANTIVRRDASGIFSTSGIAIGVDISSAISQLHIESDGTGAQITVTGKTDATADAKLLLSATGATNVQGLKLWYEKSTAYGYIDNLYNNDGGNIYFRTKTAGTPIVALTILGTGEAIFIGRVTADRFRAIHATSTDVSALPIYVSETLSGNFGLASTPAYGMTVYSKILGANLTATDAYESAITGLYGITGTNASVYPKAGVLGWIADNTTTADGAFIALIDGDTQITQAGAAYGVRYLNSTPTSGFDYGLDLYGAAIGAYDAVSYRTADIRLSNSAVINNSTVDLLTITEATVDIEGALIASTLESDGNVKGTTYGSGGSPIPDATLLGIDDGATTEILVGGGAGVIPVWTTATGTGAPVRAGDPAFTGFPTTPAAAPDADYEVANKKYVDDNVPSSLWTDDGSATYITVDSEPMELRKTGFAHGMTGLATTDAYAKFSIKDASDGGLRILGVTKAVGVEGIRIAAVTTQTTPTQYPMKFSVAKQSSTTWSPLTTGRLGFAFYNDTQPVMTLNTAAWIALGTAETFHQIGVYDSSPSFVLTDTNVNEVIGSAATAIDTNAVWIYANDTSPEFGMTNNTGDSFIYDIGVDGLVTMATVDIDGENADIAFMPDGNVGINTNSPASTLEVNGGVNIGGTDAVGDNDLNVEGGAVIKGTMSFPNGYSRHIELQVGSAIVGSTAPSPTTVGTFRGLGFAADNEVANFIFDIPTDWDGVSDMIAHVHWYPTSGDAVANGETVKWDITYRSIAEGEAVDNGSSVTASGVLTGGASETDKELYYTDIILDYDHADQPLTSEDCVGIQFDRDVAGDSYSGSGIITMLHIQYNSIALPEG